MKSLPEPITQLTEALGKLPGIGPRSAERLALYLVQSEVGQVRQLAHSLVTAREKIEIHTTGSVAGDVSSPRLAIADGASIRGKVHVEQT